MQPTVLVLEGDDPPVVPPIEPPVVIVESSEPDDSVVELAEQVGALTVAVGVAVEAADTATETAVQAMQAADTAFALAVEPAVLEPITEAYELPDDEPQEDAAPEKVHWTHRTLKSYFGGS